MAKSKKKPKKKTGSKVDVKNVAPWNEEKLLQVKAMLEKENSKPMPVTDPRTSLVSIQYRMEYYLLTSSAEIQKIKPLEEFLGAFLKALDISFKLFALSIGTTDANLKKYLKGRRKFNIDLAMKFGSFFHTPPELWLNIQTKNDIITLMADKELRKNYEAYNYAQLLEG